MKKNLTDVQNNPAADTTKSIHLSASAGSGKTRALKDRYLALLEVLDRKGLNTDQAVAITFTDKAAAEIKDRVMQDLPEAMLKKIIRGRQDLRISTIHSFCMNLLKRYPLEAGLPPDFGILDSRDQAAKIQKAIEDALEESDRDRSFMALLTDFTADELVEAIAHLLSLRSKLKRLEIDAGGTAGLMRAVRSSMGIDETERELQAIVTDSRLRGLVLKMEQFLKAQTDFYDECLAAEHIRLAETNDMDAALTLADSLSRVYFNKDGSRSKKCYIAKSRYSGRNREEYEKIFFDIQEMLERLRNGHAQLRSGRESLGLLQLYLAAEQRYQAAKLREGLLDFDDLEIAAYGLLQGRESPGILYWLDRKILHFLVDEFQDTSDIQWAILNKLTEEIFAGLGTDKPLASTLFVVGDEKQSIYRFREANYRLIDNVKAKMESHIPPGLRSILTLDRNFRSSPEVIDTVNKVFGTLWGAAYKHSDVERKGQDGSVRLIEIDRTAAEEDPEYLNEAGMLAREIKSMITQGIIVHERTTEAGWLARAAGYGDFAILIQSRTRLKDYEAALQAGNIPYRVIGGIGFYEEDEIQALMNVLFFLWNRHDLLALAAALKSPLFGMNDGDIYELVQDETGMTDCLRRRHPREWELLHGWVGISGLVPLAGLIHRIVADTGAYIRFGRGNPQAIFNIDKLLDTAREFDRRGYTTLQDFVGWVRNIRRTEQREAAADMNLPGFQGSVSIMTVHKAKGLEYPVVFLPGMNQQQRSFSTSPLVLVEERDGVVRMGVKDGLNPVYKELWDREHEELLREHQRLLYVAMTRARDHLIMIGTLNDGSRQVKQDTWLGYLHEAAPEPLFGSRIKTGSTTRYAYPSAADGGASGLSPVTSQQQEPAASATIGSDILLQKLSPLSRADAPEWKKATDFINPDRRNLPEQRFVPGSEAVSPLTRGTVLHRCLELWTTTGAYDLDAVIREHPDIPALPPDLRQQFSNEVRNRMQSVLNHPEHAWIFEAHPQSYSELPLLYRKGDSLVSGVVDRVVIRGEAGAVIDYKAILVKNEEEVSAWLDHYRPQVRIYCEAVREIFGLKSVKGYLLFLDSNKLASCTSI